MLYKLLYGRKADKMSDPNFVSGQKRSKIVQTGLVGHHCPSLRLIVRPRHLRRDFAASGPQLQGASAEVSSKAESFGSDALQLGAISAFKWTTPIQTEAARLD
jgi:hypothetical protein